MKKKSFITLAQIIYAWGKDAPMLDLPKDVGFRYSLARFNINLKKFQF
jgi:hypothetical protein